MDQAKLAHCSYSFPCVSEASGFCFALFCCCCFFFFILSHWYFIIKWQKDIVFPFPNTPNTSNICEWKWNVYKIVIIIWWCESYKLTELNVLKWRILRYFTARVSILNKFKPVPDRLVRYQLNSFTKGMFKVIKGRIKAGTQKPDLSLKKKNNQQAFWLHFEPKVFSHQLDLKQILLDWLEVHLSAWPL